MSPRTGPIALLRVRPGRQQRICRLKARCTTGKERTLSDNTRTWLLRDEMIARLDEPGGRTRYSPRIATIEPVFAYFEHVAEDPICRRSYLLETSSRLRQRSRSVRRAVLRAAGCVRARRVGTVRLLLDTHALLWWLLDDPCLSVIARAAISDAASPVLVSTASAWEMATKQRFGKLPRVGVIVGRLPVYLRESRFEPLPIGLEEARLAGSLPGGHRDPFDRMIAAQARLHGLSVVTLDPELARLGATVLW